jgi:hypothetical protein
MRNTGLAVGFVATVAVLVPAGWHLPDAEVAGDGKRVRPTQQSFVIDGAKVTLDVDRSMIETGGKVHATLVAYSDKPKQVAVEMTVLHSSNYEGERVEEVPTVIDKEKLTLQAKPGGGKPVETTLRLGEHVGRMAMTDTFRIFVAKKGVRPNANDPSWYDQEAEADEDAPKAPKTAALVTIIGWSGNNLDLAIEPEGKARGDEPFFVKVRVKNTSGKKVYGLWVNLGTSVNGYGSVGSNDDFDIEQVDEEDGSYDKALGRNRTMVKRFKVTPKRKGIGNVTFVANAISTNNDIGPVVAGALNAKTVQLRDGSAVAAK